MTEPRLTRPIEVLTPTATRDEYNDLVDEFPNDPVLVLGEAEPDDGLETADGASAGGVWRLMLPADTVVTRRSRFRIVDQDLNLEATGHPRRAWNSRLRRVQHIEVLAEAHDQ